MRALRPLLSSIFVGFIGANACLTAPDRDFTPPTGADAGSDASMATDSGTGGSSGSGGGGSGGGGALPDGDIPDAPSCMNDGDCNDGNFCNGEETCSNGTCAPGQALADETECTVQKAVTEYEGGTPEAGVADAGGSTVIGTFPGLCYGGACLQKCNQTSDCDDQDYCTGQETCDGARGVCVQGVAPTCEDGNDCTEDRCDMAVGNPADDYCVHTLLDADGDGHAPSSLGECGDDCNDDDAEVFTGAPEICDEMDNDCDGEPEANPPYWYVDCDEDGFAEDTDNAVQDCDKPSTPPAICGGAGQWVLTAPVSVATTDCNDQNEHEFPGNPEVCDGFDNDCSGIADDVAPRRWADCDGDAYARSDAASVWDCDANGGPAQCPTGEWTTIEPVPGSADCNDSNADIRPGADDCSGTPGVDDNCDGVTDSYRWYRDCDNDGYAASTANSTTGCTEPAPAAGCSGGWTRIYPTGLAEDCDDTKPLVHRYAGFQTTPDDVWGFDYNCDGQVSKQYSATEVATNASCAYASGGGPIALFGCEGTSGWTGRAVPECGETAHRSICRCAPTNCQTILCLFCSNGCERVNGDAAQGCR